MDFVKCEKCGEEVDGAKAFCPECGNPFVVEEKRESSSEFDNYAGTVNVSKSMYQMMLSDMDLIASRKAEEKPEPPPAPVTEVKEAPRHVALTPIPPDNDSSGQINASGYNPIVIAALISGLILLIFAAIALSLLYLFVS